MNIFLDWREKYYGIKAEDEKNLRTGYLNANNGTGIAIKLDECRKWGAENKTKAIDLLELSICMFQLVFCIAGLAIAVATL